MAVYGACDTWGGSDNEGVASLIDYANSAAMQKKKKIVKDIAQIMKAEGLIEGDLPDDLSKLVAKMFEKIGPGTKIGGSPQVQAELIKKLANAMNQYFPGSVSLKAEPAAQLQQIGEVLYALGTGMHSEFLVISNNLKTTLQNLLDLKSMMSLAIGQISTTLEDCKEGTDLKLSGNKEAMKLIMDELDRQVGLIQMLTNTILEPGEQALVENSKIFEIIKRVDSKEKGGAYGKELTALLRALTSTALAAQKVYEGIKQTGLSIQDYKNSPTTQELHSKIVNALKNQQNISGEKFGEFWQGATKLFTRFDKKDEIIKYLEDLQKMSTGAGETSAAGGFIEFEEKPVETKIEKQVKKLKEQKALILSSFNRELSTIVKRIFDALKSLAAKSASEQMPVTDKLEGFVKNISQLNEVQNKNMFYALSGIDTEPTARKLRELYVENIKTLNGFIDQIVSAPEYSGVADMFKELKSSFDALLLLIGTYQDKISQIWGGEVPPSATGAADEPKYKIEEFSRSTVELDRVIKEFVYFFNVAQIRRNLAATSKEIDSYGVDYERTLGMAIAKKKEERDKKLESLIVVLDGNIMDSEDRKKAGAITQQTFDTTKKENEEIKRIFKSQHKALDDFYRVVQAIDLYAKAFTSAAVQNPNDIKDLKLQLSEVEFIAKFFNDKSGDLIAEVFDWFPFIRDSDHDDTNPKPSVLKYTDLDNGATKDDHYYDKIGRRLNVSDFPGFHLNARDLFDGEKKNYDVICEKLQNAVESSAVLKNLVNVFTTIGRKFGEHILDKETFMTPKQIYSGLVDFIVKSSIEYHTHTFLIQVLEKWTIKVRHTTDFNQKYQDELKRSRFYNTGSITGSWETVAQKNKVETSIDSFIDAYVERIADIEQKRVNLAATFRALTDAFTAWNGAMNDANRRAYYVALSNFTIAVAKWNDLVDVADRISVSMDGGGLVVFPTETTTPHRIIQAQTGAGPREDAQDPTYMTYPADPFDSANIIQAGVIAGDINAINPIPILATPQNANYARIDGLIGILRDYTLDNSITNDQLAIINREIAKYRTFDNTVPALNPKTNILIAGWGNPVKAQFKQYLNSTPEQMAILLQKVQNAKTKTDFNNDLQYIIDILAVVTPTTMPSTSAAGLANELLTIKREAAVATSNIDALKNKIKKSFADFYTLLETERAKRKEAKTELYQVVKMVNKHDKNNLFEIVPTWPMKDNITRGIIMTGAYNGPINPFNGWEDEMDLFAMVVKTMVAKTFATVGLYDLLERPGEIPSLAPIRMILGGDDEFPKVEEGALELYIRLPLLAEYYRELFQFDTPAEGIDGDKNVKFAMLPELDGTFSKLIKLVFKTTKYINVGTYTDPDTKELILIINEIFSKFASDANPIQSAIFAFVAEVNRRYGIITNKDRDAYEKLYARPKNPYPSEEISKISILPDEEDIEFRRLAPSETFMEGQSKKISWKTEDKLDPKFKKAFRKFRHDIDKIFDVQRQRFSSHTSYEELLKASSKYSFKELINQSRASLKKASKDGERYDVAAKLIQEVSAFSKADHLMAVMFHETVLVGIDLLMGVYQYLRDFRTTIEKINPGNVVKLIIKKAPTTITNGDIATVNKHFTIPAGGQITFAAGVINTNDINETDFVAQHGNDFSLNPNEKNKFRDLIEACVDRHFPAVAAFKEFMEVIITHANDLQGLVEVKFSDDNMYIEYNNLIDTITRLFDSTKFYYNKFRGILNDNDRKKFEEPDQPGSLYFIEEYLMEDLIRGSKKEGLVRQTNSINKLNEEISETFKRLTSYRKYAVGGGTVANFSLLSAANDTDKNSPANGFIKNHYDYFTSSSYYADGFILGFKVFDQTSTATSMLESRDSRGKIVYLKHLGGSYQIYDDSLTPNLNNAKADGVGALIRFNNLLFNLLRTCFDTNTRHIYAPMVNTFINSSLNNSIMGNAVIPDACTDLIEVIKPATGTVPRVIQSLVDMEIAEVNFSQFSIANLGDIPQAALSMRPNPDGILFSSIGAIIRNLHSGFSTSINSKITTESLADIPLFIRETMKANLPVYEKMFELLRLRCNILRTALEKGARVHSANSANALPAFTNVPIPGGGINQKSESGGFKKLRKGDIIPQSQDTAGIIDIHKRLDGVLKSVADGCQTAVKAIKQTLSDMNDTPNFMELNQDFLNDYQSTNSKQPITLLSSILSPLRNEPAPSGIANAVNKNVVSQEEMEFMPISVYGQEQFKFLYGTRSVLRSTIKAVPEMINKFGDFVNFYNALVNPMYAIDSNRLNEFTIPAIKLTRYLVDLKQYKSWISPLYTNVNYYARADLNKPPAINTSVFGRTPSNVLTDPDNQRTPQELLVFQINLSNGRSNQLQLLSNSVDITESKYQDDRLSLIASRVISTSITSDRGMIRVYNILDMNIVPINVHAMMRDIPLINLYNYSWTFDSMICDLLQVKKDDIINCDQTPEYRQSEARFMTRMIVCPYQKITNDDYNTYMANIFRGYTDTEMGRPKFLSDQIFNKALFGEVYSAPYQWNKRGPQARDTRNEITSYNETVDRIIRLYTTRVNLATNDPTFYKDVKLIKDLALPIYNLYKSSNTFNLAALNSDANIDSSYTAFHNYMTTTRGYVPGTAIGNTWSNKNEFLSSFLNNGKNGFDQVQEIDIKINPYISYLKHMDNAIGRSDPNKSVVVVPFQDRVASQTMRKYLNLLGKFRFDSYFIRSMLFIGQLHRLITYKIGKDLMAHSDIVVKGNAIFDPNVVDYALNRAWNPQSHVSTSMHTAAFKDDQRL